jgi:hypothetical protein
MGPKLLPNRQPPDKVWVAGVRVKRVGKSPGDMFVFEAVVRIFGQRERVKRFKIRRTATH